MSDFKINAKTNIYGIIGNPVEHSMSPAIHNAAFRELNLNNAYVAFKVENLKNAIEGIRALNIKGLSVTIPHKQKILNYLDEVDTIAARIGAVNTVVNQGGKLSGTNSDGSGAYKAIIDSGVNLYEKKAVILGSGGAARAIGFTIASEDYLKELVIAGINENEYKSLADEITEKTSNNVTGINISNLEKHVENVSLIINCSPIGMHPHVDKSPISKELLNQDMTVFDIVYNPLETKLLRDAQDKNCKIIHGTEMFLNQAVIQFELWTGKRAPVETMKKVLFQNLGI